MDLQPPSSPKWLATNSHLFDGGGIVHSAPRSTYAKGSVTEDGWNDMYVINGLAPILLEVSLLHVLDGALIVNVSSTAHSLGVADYFSDKKNGLSTLMARRWGLQNASNGTDHAKCWCLWLGTLSNNISIPYVDQTRR